MNSSIYLTKTYQEAVQNSKDKEAELLRLLQVKAEKVCNTFLVTQYHTQLSYLSRDEQDGAVSVPKGIILDKMLAYLRSL